MFTFVFNVTPMPSQSYEEYRNPRGGVLAGVGRTGLTWLAIFYTTFYLCLRRGLFAIVTTLTLILRGVGFYRLIATPWLAAALAFIAECAVIIMGVLSPSLPSVVILPVSAFLLGVVIIGARAILELPRSLRELRAPTALTNVLLAPHLRSPLDAIFTRLLICHSLLLGPPFVALMIPGLRSPQATLLYVITVTLCSETFELLDHTNIHNNVFAPSKRCEWPMRCLLRTTALWHEYVATLMIGRIPFWYRVQHVFIHHVENNGPRDPQSTLRYDRTSYLDFCLFAFKMGVSFCLPWDVCLYLVRAKRRWPLRMLLAHMLGYTLLIGVLILWNFPAAVVLLSIRFSSGVGAALLNFYEHGLVDPTDPLNVYGNASTVQIQSEEDHGYFAGDFHIAHHLHPGRHWSLLLEEVRNSESAYRAMGVIVYHDTKLFVQNLLTRRFDDIASHCVPNGMTPKEMAAEIQRRASPREPKRRHALARRADELLGSLVARALI
jgi:hypothetical protein